MVRCLNPSAMVCDGIQNEARIIARRLYCLGTVFVKQCLRRRVLSVVYRGTNNKLRIRERVELMVCHSDRVSSPKVTTNKHQFPKSNWQGFFTKRFWMCRFAKLTSVWNCFVANIVLYHQYCTVLSCTATPVSKQYWFWVTF